MGKVVFGKDAYASSVSTRVAAVGSFISVNEF